MKGELHPSGGDSRSIPASAAPERPPPLARSSGPAAPGSAPSPGAPPPGTDAERSRRIAAELDRKKLDEGFPAGYRVARADGVPLVDGSVARMDGPLSAGELAELERLAREGRVLGWFFEPGHPRYQRKGITGVELLELMESGEFLKHRLQHVTFIYGWFWENCKVYYMLHRLSGDRYYVEQLAKYAEGTDWILEKHPELMLPEDRRDAMRGKVTADNIPHEPAAASNLAAYVHASRLVLEEALEAREAPEARRAARARPSPDVERARRWLETTVRYMRSLVGDPRTPDEELGVPPVAAEMIRKTPWNQSMMCFSVLAGTALALEDLQKMDGDARHRETIDLYTSIVVAGIRHFKRHSDLTFIDGKPYTFHSHSPADPYMGRLRGHPIFRYPEDIPHSQSQAWHLIHLYEMDERFGVSEALLAGFVNAIVDYHYKTPRVRDERKKRDVPANHLASPWTLEGRPDKKWDAIRRLGQPYVSYGPFRRDVVVARKPWARRGGSLDEVERVYLLFGKRLHAAWREREGG